MKDKFLLLNKAKDLITHSFTLTSNTNRYPKRYRFTLVNRIQDTVMKIHRCILEANELNVVEEHEKRRDLQMQAIVECKVLLFLIDVSHERGFINGSTCKHWAKMVIEIRDMTAGWRQSDQNRKGNSL